MPCGALILFGDGIAFLASEEKTYTKVIHIQRIIPGTREKTSGRGVSRSLQRKASTLHLSNSRLTYFESLHTILGLVFVEMLLFELCIDRRSRTAHMQPQAALILLALRSAHTFSTRWTDDDLDRRDHIDHTCHIDRIDHLQ